MKRVTVPSVVKSDSVNLFTEWLDQHSVIWTRSGQCINLFAMPDELEGGISFFLEDVLGGAQLEEVAIPAASVPPVAAASVPAAGPADDGWTSLTWYQFRDRVRAETLHLPRLADVLDKILGFSKTGEGKDAVYTWAMHRVDVVETQRRYRGSNGRIEMYEVKYNRSTGKWEHETVITLPDEEAAPDLVKFGKTMTPEEYWHNREMQALHIDWKSPRNIFMLTTAIRLASKGEEEK